MVTYKCIINQCIRAKKDKNVFADYPKFKHHLLTQHTPLELAIHIIETTKDEIVS